MRNFLFVRLRLQSFCPALELPRGSRQCGSPRAQPGAPGGWGRGAQALGVRPSGPTPALPVPGAPRAPSRAVTNLRLSASWRGAQAPPRPPAPSSGPAAAGSVERSARASAAAFPGVWEAGRGGPSLPVGLPRPRPECARVSFPVSTLIGASSAPPSSRGEPEALTPCALPHGGLRGGGAAGDSGGHGGDQCSWANRSLEEPAGSEEPAKRGGAPGESRPRGPGRLVNVQALPGDALTRLPGLAGCGPERHGRQRLLEGSEVPECGAGAWPSRTLSAGTWTAPTPKRGPGARPRPRLWPPLPPGPGYPGS